MTICFLHGSHCPNKRKKTGYGNQILLLSPPTMPFVDLHSPAKTQLKLMLQEADLRVDEYCSNDDTTMCALCSAVNQARVVVADITLRDPHVYVGIALSQACDKPVYFVAHSQASIAEAFDLAVSYASSLPPDFEAEVQELIVSINEALKKKTLPLLPHINADELTRLLSTPKGNRTSKDRRTLEETWNKIIERCQDQLSSGEWNKVLPWHKNAEYDNRANLLKLRPAREDREQARELLQNPAFRHTMENAIFELSGQTLNWTIVLERVIVLND